MPASEDGPLFRNNPLKFLASAFRPSTSVHILFTLLNSEEPLLSNNGAISSLVLHLFANSFRLGQLAT